MGKEWSEERKKAASEAYAKRNEVNKSAEAHKRTRVSAGAPRDITAVKDTPNGFIDRWVNDHGDRIKTFQSYGYKHVEEAAVGDPGVDGTHAGDGVVSRDMGKGITAYLMRQRRDDYEYDQTLKQEAVDRTEDGLRRDKNENRNDGTYGEVKIT